MSYPHQPGSPLFDGAEAFEAYCKEMDEAPFEIVTCDACDGYGNEVFGITVYEPGCGFSHDSTDERPCKHCGGAGVIYREAQP
jgi:DnaJ-class molecular chaperone